MDSRRLRLSYRSVVPVDDGGETVDWGQGLHPWLERVRRRWSLLPLDELPWLRWVLPLLILLPALTLMGWIHQAGQQRILNASPEWSATPELALLHAQPAATMTELAMDAATMSAPAPSSLEPITWAPIPERCERHATDHPNVPDGRPVRVKVLIIQARVTAYTPYDHATSHPQWADGVVAWHPDGRKRRVVNHKYGLATDWSQFPPGSTFINIPGYMDKTFPRFPEAFRVVDDACGRARQARRRGEKPVIDVRFMTRYSAIDSKNGWGSRHLEVEVIVPEDYTPPRSLRRWIVREEWRTYGPDGRRID